MKKILLLILSFLVASIFIACEDDPISCGPKIELWDTAYCIENIIELDLTSNNLSGEIPDEIGNLYNLVELNLNNNELSGQIPNQIGNLINLEYLSLIKIYNIVFIFVFILFVRPPEPRRCHYGSIWVSLLIIFVKN